MKKTREWPPRVRVDEDIAAGGNTAARSPRAVRALSEEPHPRSVRVPSDRAR